MGAGRQLRCVERDSSAPVESLDDATHLRPGHFLRVDHLEEKALVALIIAGCFTSSELRNQVTDDAVHAPLEWVEHDALKFLGSQLGEGNGHTLRLENGYAFRLRSPLLTPRHEDNRPA